MSYGNNFNQIRAFVTGATSQIGYFLLPRLHAAGFQVIALSRQSRLSSDNTIWRQINLATTPLAIEQPSLLFHIAPLPLLPKLLTLLPEQIPLLRVIAFSSTSRFTKINSVYIQERRIANELAQAEEDFITICTARNIDWTLFRPTLVYGCGRDKNVTFIAHFIRRFGFFPILGQGLGLRQPVHADDLAAACVQAYKVPATHNQAYNLSGQQILSYRNMVETIFRYLGKSPRILSVPPTIFALLDYGTRWLLPFARLPIAMVARMNQDLCFDHSSAYHDFGYQPRVFSDSDLGC